MVCGSIWFVDPLSSTHWVLTRWFCLTSYSQRTPRGVGLCGSKGAREGYGLLSMACGKWISHGSSPPIKFPRPRPDIPYDLQLPFLPYSYLTLSPPRTLACIIIRFLSRTSLASTSSVIHPMQPDISLTTCSLSISVSLTFKFILSTIIFHVRGQRSVVASTLALSSLLTGGGQEWFPLS